MGKVWVCLLTFKKSNDNLFLDIHKVCTNLVLVYLGIAFGFVWVNFGNLWDIVGIDLLVK